MAVVIGLLPDAVARARLGCPAVSRIHDVMFAETWPELHALALRVPAQVAVADPYRHALLQLAECERFRSCFPSVTFVAYARFTQERIHDVVRLSRLGVADIIVRDVDDAPASVVTMLNDCLTTALHNHVLRELRDIVPPPVVPLFTRILREAYSPLSPSSLAHALCCHEKTLRDRLRAAGLPSTMKMIIWARLFHAASALQDRQRTAESVAVALRFPSASALRNQLMRYARVRPRALSEGNGLAVLLLRFRNRYARGDWGADADTESGAIVAETPFATVRNSFGGV